MTAKTVTEELIVVKTELILARTERQASVRYRLEVDWKFFQLARRTRDVRVLP